MEPRMRHDEVFGLAGASGQRPHYRAVWMPLGLVLNKFLWTSMPSSGLRCWYIKYTFL